MSDFPLGPEDPTVSSPILGLSSFAGSTFLHQVLEVHLPTGEQGPASSTRGQSPAPKGSCWQSPLVGMVACGSQESGEPMRSSCRCFSWYPWQPGEPEVRHLTASWPCFGCRTNQGLLWLGVLGDGVPLTLPPSLAKLVGSSCVSTPSAQLRLKGQCCVQEFR